MRKELSPEEKVRIRSGQIAVAVLIIICIILLLFTHCAASAVEDNPNAWTTADTMFQVTYAALHITDWGQTLNISKSGDRWRETNPILGPHPKQSTVNYYFAGTLAAHTAIAYLLPKDWRRVWQMVWIGIEGAYVYKNFELGIGVGF